MCRINCSGGCPECCPEDHVSECILSFNSGITEVCICDNYTTTTLEDYLPKIDD